MTGTDGSDVDPRVRKRVQRAHERIDEAENIHQQFDRRIERNENWRLQAQGALKAILVILGSGGIAFLIDAFFGML